MNESKPGGWISLHKSIMYNWIWDTPKYLKWWLDMLFLAEYKDTKRFIVNKTYLIKRGSFVASLRFLRERWMSIDAQTGKKQYPTFRTIIKFLNLLESEKMIVKNTTKNPRLIAVITICNYDRYQTILAPLDSSVESSADSGRESSVESSADSGVNSSHESSADSKFNNNIYSSPTHACACACEDFKKELLEKYPMFWQQAATTLHTDVATLQNLLDEFQSFVDLKGKRHENFQDYRNHFVDWARKNLSNSKSQNYENRQNSKVNERRERDDEFARHIYAKLGSD